MKKLHSFIVCTLVACLTSGLFSSCEGNSGLAPKSIVGKTFNSEWPADHVRFTSSSSFVYEKDPNGEQHLPIRYSYRKTSDDMADLTLEYKVGSIYAQAGEERLHIISLFFTTSETGWYVDHNGKHNFTLR